MIKIGVKRYNLVLNHVKAVCKNYQVDRIPVSYFENCIDKVKFTKEEITELNNEKMAEFCERFNESLSMMVTFAKTNGKDIGDNKVSYNEVRNWINHSIKGFKNAANGKK